MGNNPQPKILTQQQINQQKEQLLSKIFQNNIIILNSSDIELLTQIDTKLEYKKQKIQLTIQRNFKWPHILQKQILDFSDQIEDLELIVQMDGLDYNDNILSTLFGKMTHLKYLSINLGYNKIKDKQSEEIKSVLSQLDHLELLELRLQSCVLEDNQLKKISESFNFLPQLNKLILNLINNQIANQTLETIKGLNEHPYLQRLFLDISSNNLNEHSLNKFGYTISELYNLIECTFICRNNNINKSHIEQIFLGLSKSKKLEKLNVYLQESEVLDISEQLSQFIGFEISQIQTLKNLSLKFKNISIQNEIYYGLLHTKDLINLNSQIIIEYQQRKYSVKQSQNDLILKYLARKTIEEFMNNRQKQMFQYQVFKQLYEQYFSTNISTVFWDLYDLEI